MEWRRTDGDRLQAVVVLSVPTSYTLTDNNGWISIPLSLMVTRDEHGNNIKPHYANVHVHKLYVLNPGSSTAQPMKPDGDRASQARSAVELVAPAEVGPSTTKS